MTERRIRERRIPTTYENLEFADRRAAQARREMDRLGEALDRGSRAFLWSLVGVAASSLIFIYVIGGVQ